MTIALLGLGNLGSAVAQLIATNGHAVMAWEHDEAVVDEVNRQHGNSRYLPGITLCDKVRATNDISALLQQATVLVNCLPSRFIQPVLAPLAGCLPSHAVLVNMAKGIDQASRQTACQQLAVLFPDNPLVMVAGPSLANEFVRGINTVVVAASVDNAAARKVAGLLANDRFHVQLSADVRGVELGGILKNIYAIGLGAAHDQGQPGLNFVGAYLSQALAEMQRIGVALGASSDSFYGFSGLGDLLATAMSEQSHNFRFGRLIGQGLSLAEAGKQTGLLPEGVNTLQVMSAIADEQQLAVPLLQALQQLLECGGDIRTFAGWQ